MTDNPMPAIENKITTGNVLTISTRLFAEGDWYV
jgi:hypothetical protein